MELPPLLPKNPPTDWLSRNWKWLVPLLGLAVIVMVGCFVMTLFGFMKSSDAYNGAVVRVRASAPVAEAIGTPIQEGFLVTGSISTNGASGKAELAIPIEGPKGKATIYVEAKKSLGEWRFEHLIVEVERSHERIDVLKRAVPVPVGDVVPNNYGVDSPAR